MGSMKSMVRPVLCLMCALWNNELTSFGFFLQQSGSNKSVADETRGQIFTTLANYQVRPFALSSRFCRGLGLTRLSDSYLWHAKRKGLSSFPFPYPSSPPTLLVPEISPDIRVSFRVLKPFAPFRTKWWDCSCPIFDLTPKCTTREVGRTRVALGNTRRSRAADVMHITLSRAKKTESKCYFRLDIHIEFDTPLGQ